VDGPRFALRFEDGSGRLVLAKPLRFAYGVVDELALDLGPLSFPLDLSAGAGRFRFRRTRVRSARVRLDLASLLESRVDEPLALSPLAPLEEGMAFALSDAFGTIALDAHARFEGPRLRVAPSRARAVQEGPAAPLVRVIVAARALGFELEEDRGALVIERPLSALLTEAMVPWGWRVPDDRSTRLVIEALGSRRVALRTLDTGEPEPPPAAAWERARALAPAMSLLAIGQVDAAARAFETLRERNPTLDGSDLGFGDPREDGPRARCVALRDALRAGDLSAAARAADAFEAVESCDAVAVEGLCAAADLVMATRPRLAVSLLERACAREPSEARHALRLIEVAARLGDSDELDRLVELGLAAREPGPNRGAFAREAAGLCELAGLSAPAARLWRLAAESLPNDARVLEGLGRLLSREKDLRGSLDAFDRAASAFAREVDRGSEADALREGALRATEMGDHAAAESRLARAGALTDDARIWVSLASARRALGREESALRAEDRLLSAVQREAHPSDAVVAALAFGAREALRVGALARAQAWRAALVRARPDDPAGEELASEIEEAQLAAVAEDPEHILALDPERCSSALSRAANREALVVEALAASEDLDAALAALAHELDGDLGPAIANIVSARGGEVSDGGVLLAIAGRAQARDEREALLLAARRRLRQTGPAELAARAQAALGVLRRDMTMLRAALTAAEREGAVAVAKDIVQMALGVVGDGPARAALITVMERLQSQPAT